MTVAVNQRITISAQTAYEARVPAQSGKSLLMKDADGREVSLPSKVEETLLRTLAAIAEGSSVSIAQIPDELTSTAAADLLGVSRPTLLRWAREGMIPAHPVGSHTRFHRADVLHLRQERELERRAAFEKLRALDAEDDFAFYAD